MDLRKYGVGRIPLIRDGATRATSDADEALALAVKALEAAKHHGATKSGEGRPRSMSVLEVAREYEADLDQLVARGDLRASTVKRYRLALRDLLQSFDSNGMACTPALDQDRRIDTLTGRDVRRALAVLRTRVTRLGKPYSNSSLHQVLVVLNELCEFARGLGVTPETFDPVGALKTRERPKLGKHRRTDFFEVPEMAALLDVLEHDPDTELPLYEITATMAYTGARKEEVIGLCVSDLDFERELIHFRENAHRDIKANGDRVGPFWPDLQVILGAHLRKTGRVSGLVFTGPRDLSRTKKIRSGLIKALRAAKAKAIARVPVAMRESFAAKRIHPHAFRTTYCAARLQTLDNGAPVSPLVVSKELGHSTLAMIERVYARLGTVRVRGSAVSYRGPATVAGPLSTAAPGLSVAATDQASSRLA